VELALRKMDFAKVETKW